MVTVRRTELEDLEVLWMWVATDDPEGMYSASQSSSVHSDVTPCQGNDTIYARGHAGVACRNDFLPGIYQP